MSSVFKKPKFIKETESLLLKCFVVVYQDMPNVVTGFSSFDLLYTGKVWGPSKDVE